MKLMAGFKYLRGPGGDVVPYSEALHKAAGEGYVMFVPQETYADEKQLAENEKVAPARKSVAIEMAKKDAPKPQAKPVPKFVHQDIRKEMEADLANLES